MRARVCLSQSAGQKLQEEAQLRRRRSHALAVRLLPPQEREIRSKSSYARRHRVFLLPRSRDRDVRPSLLLLLHDLVCAREYSRRRLIYGYDVSV